MTIDGAPGPEPAQGISFTVDEKLHTLAFTCSQDMCEPQSKKIEPGADDQSIVVEMKILPAKLVVEGDPTHSYGINELPGYTLGSGVPTDITMTGGTRTVTVMDRTDPTQQKKVTLKAGKQEVVTFR